MTSPVKRPGDPGYEEVQASLRARAADRRMNFVMYVLVGAVAYSVLEEKFGLVGWYGIGAAYITAGLAAFLVTAVKFCIYDMRTSGIDLTTLKGWVFLIALGAVSLVFFLVVWPLAILL